MDSQESLSEKEEGRSGIVREGDNRNSQEPRNASGLEILERTRLPRILWKELDLLTLWF